MNLIEPIPNENSGVSEQQVRELKVETDSYEAGVANLSSQVPEGWRIINLRRATP